ncbi:Protein SMALL AUXIN UP-REGULATED RNA 54 [Linum grandiflorum]
MTAFSFYNAAIFFFMILIKHLSFCIRMMPTTGGGSLMLKQIMKILHQRFNLPPSYTGEDFDDVDLSSEVLPEDVKEGHFVVHTANDGEPKRCLIRLDYLAHPGIIRLLELAEEEFGLRQAGVLAVPCRSVELQNILGSTLHVDV